MSSDIAKGIIQAHRADKHDVGKEKRLLWKIDLLLMPIMTVTTGLQYYDKGEY